LPECRKPHCSRVLLSVLVLSCAMVAAVAISAQEPASQQKRPRRVADSASQVPKPSPNSVEEVGEGDVIRVETQLVSVPAIVTNSLGRPVPALRAENFVVFEVGKQRAIANFGTTDAPFQVAMTLD